MRINLGHFQPKKHLFRHLYIFRGLPSGRTRPPLAGELCEPRRRYQSARSPGEHWRVRKDGESSENTQFYSCLLSAGHFVRIFF